MCHRIPPTHPHPTHPLTPSHLTHLTGRGEHASLRQKAHVLIPGQDDPASHLPLHGLDTHWAHQNYLWASKPPLRSNYLCLLLCVLDCFLNLAASACYSLPYVVTSFLCAHRLYRFGEPELVKSSYMYYTEMIISLTVFPPLQQEVLIGPIQPTTLRSLSTTSSSSCGSWSTWSRSVCLPCYNQGIRVT